MNRTLGLSVPGKLFLQFAGYQTTVWEEAVMFLVAAETDYWDAIDRESRYPVFNDLFRFRQGIANQRTERIEVRLLLFGEPLDMSGHQSLSHSEIVKVVPRKLQSLTLLAKSADSKVRDVYCKFIFTQDSLNEITCQILRCINVIATHMADNMKMV